MEQKGAIGSSGRIVQRIEVTYRLPDDDPKGGYRTMIVEHSGEGQEIDAMIWSRALVEKLAYLEKEDCRPVERQQGKEWRVLLKEESGGESCIWVHDPSCIWWEYCGPII